MAHKLRILHLDGDSQDTELMIAAFRDAGTDCEVVRTVGQSRRLIATGAEAYLTKPLDVPRMLDRIDERLTA